MKKLLAAVLLSVLIPSLSFGQAEDTRFVDGNMYSYDVANDPEAVSANMLQIVQKLPFVRVNATGNKITVSELSDITLYIDGIPQSHILSNLADYLSSLPANVVEKVEVRTSLKATDHVRGDGGIINIITRKRTADGITAEATAQGSTSTQVGGNILFNARYNKFFFNANYSYKHWNYAEFTQENENSYLSETKKRHNKYNNALLNTGVQLTDKDLIGLSFNINGNSGLTDNLSKELPEKLPYFQNSSFARFRDYNLTAYYNHNFSGGAVLGVRYEYGYTKSQPKHSSLLSSSINESTLFFSESNIYYRIREHAFRADLSLPVGRISTLAAGVRYAFRNDDYIQKNASMVVQESNTPELLPPASNVLSYSKNEYYPDFNRLSGYLQYALNLSPFNLSIGLNVENPYDMQTKVDKDLMLYPFLGMGWQIDSKNRISFNYAMQRTAVEPYIDLGLTLKWLSKMNLNYRYNSEKFQLMGDVVFSESPDSYYIFGNQLSNESNLTFHYSDTYYRQLGFTVAARYMPSKVVHLNAAGSFTNRFVKIISDRRYYYRSNHQQITAGADFILPHKVKLGINGGYYFPIENAELNEYNNYYYRINLSKAFMNDRLFVALFATDFFGAKHLKTTNDSGTNVTKYHLNIPTNEFGISLSYRFNKN